MAVGVIDPLPSAWKDCIEFKRTRALRSGSSSERRVRVVDAKLSGGGEGEGENGGGENGEDDD